MLFLINFYILLKCKCKIRISYNDFFEHFKQYNKKKVSCILNEQEKGSIYLKYKIYFHKQRLSYLLK